MDVVEFLSQLVSFESVTPKDAGAIDFISDNFKTLGFNTHIFEKNGIKNFFASYEFSGNSDKKITRAPKNGDEKILAFVGHSDVVPAGVDWKTAPFKAEIIDGKIFARGVADMKGGIAAFFFAIKNFLQKKCETAGAIYVLITGDEEVGSYDGMRRLLDWCQQNKKMPTDCLLAEPSSLDKLGDRIYIGHRGSINIEIMSRGIQRHVAYGVSKNSLSEICRFIAHVLDYKWRHEDKRFPKISIEPTLLHSPNYAVNVVPDFSSANINVRFGADYTSEDIIVIFNELAKNFDVELKFNLSGEAYCCENPKLKNQLADAILEVVGLQPEFSCAGGTSDGRFIVNLCNVIEFGIQDATIHQKNENISVEDLKRLAKIYEKFIENYFLRQDVS